MVKLLLWLIGGSAVFVVAAQVIGHSLNAPGHQGDETDHFNGTHFRNVEPVKLPDASMGLRMLWDRSERGEWKPWREIEPTKPTERVDNGDLQVTFVGHATMLIQMDGQNILTDPVYGKRASPFKFLGPSRAHAPGIAFEDLPPIDVVLISHNHYDHLEIDTLKRVVKEHRPLLLVGLGVGELLEQNGIYNYKELDWGGELEHNGLRYVGQRSRHFSNRGFGDRMQTLWLAFIIDGPSGPVYFGGDTGYGSHFAETGREFGPVRLALLPIGAYAPRWFMGPLHMNPSEAVQAHRDLGAHQSVGIHFGTFRLTQEAQDEPVKLLREALEAQDVEADAFWALEPGESRSVVAASIDRRAVGGAVGTGR